METQRTSKLGDGGNLLLPNWPNEYGISMTYNKGVFSMDFRIDIAWYMCLKACDFIRSCILKDKRDVATRCFLSNYVDLKDFTLLMIYNGNNGFELMSIYAGCGCKRSHYRWVALYQVFKEFNFMFSHCTCLTCLSLFYTLINIHKFFFFLRQLNDNPPRVLA